MRKRKHQGTGNNRGVAQRMRPLAPLAGMARSVVCTSLHRLRVHEHTHHSAHDSLPWHSPCWAARTSIAGSTSAAAVGGMHLASSSAFCTSSSSVSPDALVSSGLRVGLAGWNLIALGVCQK